MKKQTTAVGYCRVSTTQQSEEGLSLDAQKQKIEQWCSLNDANLIEIYSDAGISGSNGNRPGFQQAIKIATTNKAVLIVYSLSRFSRSLSDAVKYSAQLRKYDADIVSIMDNIDTTTATGKFQFNVFAALNELEVSLISERTKMALDYRKSQGKKLGGDCPFGYDADGEGLLSENPDEQKIIKIINKKIAAGMNYSKIAAYLNKNKHKTKRGLSWYPQTVKNVVKASK